MKQYINLFLSTVDAVTFIQAFIQFFYFKNYEFGVIITIICSFLSIYLYIDSKKNKFYSFVRDYFCFLKELNGKCKLFRTTCIIYICLELLMCFLGSSLGNFVLILMYWILFPMFFSCYTIMFSLVNKKYTDNIIKLYGTALYFPSLFMMIGGGISITHFSDLILIIFGSILMYLPSCIISIFTISRIEQK